MKTRKVLIITPQTVDNFINDLFPPIASYFAERDYEFHIQHVPLIEYNYTAMKSYCVYHAPDVLIINDAQLQEDIITFCKSWRTNPETKQVGLFILSSYACIRAEDEWWKQWINSVDGYLSIPFELSDFERRLDKFFLTLTRS